MKLNGTMIGVGILAGLASALMSSGVIAQSGMAMVLYFFTPLPIFIAALGWGSSAGIIAAIAATAAVSIFTVPMIALLMALTSFVPAATGAYLSGLARPASELGGPKDILVWYPLPDIIFRLSLMVAASFVVVGMIIGFGPDMVRELTAIFVEVFAQADPQFKPTDEMRETLYNLFMIALPGVQPATCLLILTGNFYLALRLTSASGRLRRPRDDWPATLRMPRPALIAFAIALAAAFLPDGIGLAATTFVGTLGIGFMMAGLATLHFRTRGKSWRPVALWFTYVAIVLFAFLLFVFMVFGLFDTTRGAPISKLPDSDNDKPN